MRASLLATVVLLLAVPAEGQTVLASDFGVVVDARANNGPDLQRAVMAAVWRREPGRWAVVRLPCHAPFATSGEAIGYEGEVFLDADSVALEGCGGARVVSAEGPDGVAYAPVREVAEGGAQESRLRVRGGAVLRAYRARDRNPPATRLTVLPGPAGADVRQPRRRRHALVLRDLVLDGNDGGGAPGETSLDGMRRAMAEAPQWAEDWARNAPGHTGLNASNQGGVNLCRDDPRTHTLPDGRRVWIGDPHEPGARITLERVSITGYVSTGILGGSCSQWALHEVRLGRTAYNHSAYHADGSPATWGGWGDVTVEGYGWTHLVTSFGLTIERLVYERPAWSPLDRNGPELIELRGRDVTVRGGTFYTALPDHEGLDIWNRIAVTRGGQLDVSDVRWVARRVEGLFAGSVSRAALERVRLTAPAGVNRLLWTSVEGDTWRGFNARTGAPFSLVLSDVTVSTTEPLPAIQAAAEQGQAWTATLIDVTVNGRPARVEAAPSVTVTSGPPLPPVPPGPPPDDAP